MPVLQRTLTADAVLGTDFHADVAVPTWQVTDRGAGATRQVGAPVVVAVSRQGATYTAVVPDAVFFGDTQDVALRYLVTAIQEAALESLTARLTFRCRTSSGQLAGTVERAVLVLPARARTAEEPQPEERRLLDSDLTREAAVRPSRTNAPGLFVVDADLVAKELDGLDPEQVSTRLQLLCLSTHLDAGLPRLTPPDPATIERLGADGKKAATWVAATWAKLVDIAVTFAKPAVLDVAGTLAVTGGRGAVTAKDFAALRVTAEWSDAAGVAVARTRTFDEAATVKDGKVAFDFAGEQPVFLASVASPVRVSVRGLTGAPLFSRSYPGDDKSLPKLELSVPRQESGDLTTPAEPVPDPNLRLRGRVLAFGQTCPSTKVAVMVQARSEVDGPWRVVSAATADAGGNFTMPYPFGTYVAAQAVCSLAPDEKAEIPIVAEAGSVTISTDFLYLVVREPKVPDKPCGKGDGSCGCGGADGPSRVPGFADVIGNDDYSQDLGGGCVNLSKPNRTINEFRYQAIVRTSDPDVATYALERHEQPLEDIDPRLNEQVEAAVEAFRLQVSSVRGLFDPTLNAPSSLTRARLDQCYDHAVAAKRDVTGASGVVLDGLASARSHMEAIAGLVDATQAQRIADDFGPAPQIEAIKTAALALKVLLTTAVDAAGTSVRYELRRATGVRERPSVSLVNPIDWQGAPESPPESLYKGPAMLQSPGLKALALQHGKSRFLTPFEAEPTGPDPATAEFAQAVSVATGHVLHYKVLFKADGYSLGDLVYSLPLAPGQKKEIVVFDAAQALTGTEQQQLSQAERLAAGLLDERDITSQLGGGISESISGQSRAHTSGVSAGGGLAAGGSMGAFSAGGVIGVAGGTANSNSSASQNGSRDVAQFFGERLRQSIMQNAEGYRQLNASVVTTVQQGQQYGVTSEVVANHNHCHSMTMMYFEVLRHFAIYQELSSVEECLFVPLTLARFSVDNIAAWRDVLATALLPMPSSTYLRPRPIQPYGRPQHPLLPAFDAVKRLSTHYANVDFPEGSYDQERIRFMKGSLRLRVSLPRPKTRYDRITSLPVILKEVQTDQIDIVGTGKKLVTDSLLAGLTGGLSMLFTGAPGTNVEYKTAMIEAKAQIFDAFMSMDANFQHVRPAQCIRVKRFTPQTITFTVPWMSAPIAVVVSGEDFFAEGLMDRQQWELYAQILGYVDDSAGKGVYKLLDYYFKDRLIAEWDAIFNNDIAPLIYDKLVERLQLEEFSLDVTANGRYTGGERLMSLNLTGRTSRTRADLPEVINLTVASNPLRQLKPFVTVTVDDLRLTYATAHYNGTLYAGSVGNDLLDGVELFIPVTPDEKRNPRREDRYLAATLVEHLNTHLEHYNKVLWADLDPDRRFMLLDGFDIQTYRADGTLPASGQGMRSLASVVKNDVIGIAGNSLVMPVAPGYRVSQDLVTADAQDAAAGLFEHYQPLTPVDPYRVSVPTRGVYAEAVLGQCQACEEIEPDRAQDWTVFTTDEPTPIQPVPLSVPEPQDWQAAWRDFAAPLVNVQTAPGLPAPGVGLAGLSELLGKGDAFRDVTGLAANQNNALQTLLSNNANAKAFAEMAKEMAKQSHNTSNSDKIMRAIESARASGALSDSDANTLVKQHLQEQIDGGETQKAASDQAAKQAATPLSQAAVKAADSGKEVQATRTDAEGNAESLSITSGASSQVLAQVVGVVPKLKQASTMACWGTVAAILVGWKRGQSVTPEEAVLAAGEKYAQILADNTGLPASQKDDFVLRMRMVAEPLASYPLKEYVELVRTYGPVWITTDASPGQKFSPHARVLVKVAGKDEADPNAILTFINPATGNEESQSFGDFLKAYEEMATDNKSPTMMPQIVHFAESLEGTEGYQVEGPFNIKEPVHETISLAALQRSTVAVPVTTTVGSDLAVNEFLRGLVWNDDPAMLMFDEDRKTNWNFSSGLMWFSKFRRGEKAATAPMDNIIGRSHFFDLQFLHAMASRLGEEPGDTLAKIMMWCEVMYRLSVSDGIVGSDPIGLATPSTTYTDTGGTAHTYKMSTFFTSTTVPTGSVSFADLLGNGTKFPGFDVKRRAIGSVLHLVQDSFARGHTRRILANPGDLASPPAIDAFKPGTYGRWTDVENFHDYKSQNHADHDKYDKVATVPTPTRIETFDPILGARDAVDASVKVLNHWQAKDPWATARPTITAIFKLAPTATPADGTV